MPLSEFEAHEGDLTVVESTFSYTNKSDCLSGLTCLGTLRNDGEVQWKDLQIEVVYFDKHGSRIDTFTDRPYDTSVPCPRDGLETDQPSIGTIRGRPPVFRNAVGPPLLSLEAS